MKSNENEKFQTLIEEVKKNEEIKIKQYANRSKYVNPREYLSGKLIKPERIFTCLQKADYCPV